MRRWDKKDRHQEHMTPTEEKPERSQSDMWAELDQATEKYFPTPEKARKEVMEGDLKDSPEWFKRAFLLPTRVEHAAEVSPNLRTKALYALGYTAGLRFGEMVSLTWDCIDWEKGEVVIENREATPTMPPFHLKDYEARRIPLPKHTLGILRELQAKARFKCPFILLSEQRYKTVLENWRRYQKDGRVWENRDMFLNAGREFRRHQRKAGIKPTGSLSIHTLRKCAGKNWADALPPHVVKELMGHSTIATTMKYYAQVDATQRTRAAAAVEGLISEACRKVTPERDAQASLAS